MLLVLHHGGDAVVSQFGAAWVAATPAHDELCFLTEADLVTGVGWNYHHPRHESDWLVLPGGRRVERREISGVFNRLSWLPPVPFPDETDRRYAATELFAFALAWLNSLSCCVVNQATPTGLSGAAPALSELHRIGERAGVACRAVRYVYDVRPRTAGWDVHVAPARRHDNLGPALDHAVPLGRQPAVLLEPLGSRIATHVVGSAAFGVPEPGLVAPVVAVAELLGLGLAEVTLGWSLQRNTWVLAGVDNSPTQLPPAAMECLVEVLAAGVTARSP